MRLPLGLRLRLAAESVVGGSNSRPDGEGGVSLPSLAEEEAVGEASERSEAVG